MEKTETYVNRANRAIDEFIHQNFAEANGCSDYLYEIATQKIAETFRISAPRNPDETMLLAKLASTQYFEVLDREPSQTYSDPEELRQYKTQCLSALELFEQLLRICEQKPSATNLIYKWSQPITIQSKVFLEDDVRDALQAASITRPTLSQRKALLDITSEVGIKYSFIGFPASSERETFECKELVQHIERNNLPIIPILMARAVESDLMPILKIQQHCKIPVLVDLYICTSLLRYKIENWNLDDLLRKLELVANIAQNQGLLYRIAFEDSSRATPNMLKKAIRHAINLHPHSIVLNDTVGDLTPEGTSQLVQFVKKEIDYITPGIPLAWHGHNDKGLALANSIAAINSGATIISGTFLGFGERTGNIPLEQLIYLLHESGDVTYKLEALPSLCNSFSQMTEQNIPLNHPLIGQDVFTTATGTHAAAVAKAKTLGTSFADLAFSGVEAGLLKRQQLIILGQNTGRRGVEAFLEQFDIQYNSGDVDLLLAYCKTLTKPLTTAEEALRVISPKV